MVEILVYAFGVMYTPGPVNLLSLNAGLNGHVRSSLRFCAGVACAMLLLFLLFGYTGAWLVDSRYQLIISATGSLYIAYLAYKIFRLSVEATALGDHSSDDDRPNFQSGIIMQLLNPKSFIAILPIVTVQFPAAQISGSDIFIWSLLLAALAFGAPGSYLWMGARLGKLIHQPSYFRWLNIAMASLLLYVSADIAYHHVYLKWS